MVDTTLSLSEITVKRFSYFTYTQTKGRGGAGSNQHRPSRSVQPTNELNPSGQYHRKQ